jgi:hypothetical protein
LKLDTEHPAFVQMSDHRPLYRNCESEMGGRVSDSPYSRSLHTKVRQRNQSSVARSYYAIVGMPAALAY